MTLSSLFARILLAAALAALAGCASLQPEPAHETAYVVLGEGGAAVARVVTRAAQCPAITLDGRRMQMAARAPLQPIAPRRAQASANAQPPSSAILTCEAAIPPGTAQADVAAQPLPLPRPALNRIVVIGDTGCRVNKAEVQDCNDQEAYPFARIAAAAAAWRPDLVIHVGDYVYRDAPCPAGRAGCAGSPWGVGWDTWDADFFHPGGALLRAAPWVFARGNHETCARDGQGWWRFLDPRALALGRDCNDPADDDAGNYSDPYALPLGGAAQLIVFDTANTSYKGFAPDDPRRARYADTLRKLAVLARPGQYNIALGHHPLLAFGALRNKKSGAVSLFDGDAGLIESFGALEPGLFPRSISMVLSGHVHLWEQVSFSSAHPTQFVSGFSGTSEDIVPLPAAPPPGRGPAPGAAVEHMSSWIDGYGFMTMERTGADTWQVVVHDRDGKERNRCSVTASKSVCQVAQVK